MGKAWNVFHWRGVENYKKSDLITIGILNGAAFWMKPWPQPQHAIVKTLIDYEKLEFLLQWQPIHSLFLPTFTSFQRQNFSPSTQYRGAQLLAKWPMYTCIYGNLHVSPQNILDRISLLQKRAFRLIANVTHIHIIFHIMSFTQQTCTHLLN